MKKEERKSQSILLMLFTVIMIVLFTMVSCGSSQNKKYEYIDAPEETKLEYSGIEEYQVQAFDTLSKIATKYIPSDKYMEEWISDVKKLNNRKKSDIYYDEVIKVYVYEK